MNHSNITHKQQSTNNRLVNESERNDTTLSRISHYSTFDKSFQHATTFNAGKCVPILCQEVYPGDMYKIDTDSLIRLSAPASTPMMDLNYDVNYFFVPYDQIDPNFKQVMGENDNYGPNTSMPNFPLLVGPSNQNDIATMPQSGSLFHALDDMEDRSTSNENSTSPTNKIRIFQYGEDDLASYLGVPINSSMCGFAGPKRDGSRPQPGNVDYYYQPLNMYPFLAYGKIWNDWYRDQNVQGSIDITSCFNSPTGDRTQARTLIYPDPTDNSNYNDPNAFQRSIIYGIGLAPASKLPDLYTTCLPYQQKGTPLPIADFSNVNFNISTNIPQMNVVNKDQSTIPGMANGLTADQAVNQGFFIPNWYVSNADSSTNKKVYAFTTGFQGTTSETINQGGFDTSTGNYAIQASANTPPFDTFRPNGSLNVSQYKSQYGNSRFLTSSDNNQNNARVAWLNLVTQKGLDLNTNDGSIQAAIEGNALFNITDLRNAIVYQHLLENWALCGSRYVEQLKSIWGISIDPKAIKRTELIGGTNQSLKWNIVQQTSTTTSNSPLGSMASNLYNSLSNPTINYAAEQHGLIMAILTVRSKINYGGQGLPMIFDKKKGLDLWNPLFNGISEQPFKAKYLNYKTSYSQYALGQAMDKAFGFQEPFIDTKMNVDTASGFMSLNSRTSLFPLFLFGQKFDSTITSTSSFVGSKLINDTFMVYDPNIIGNTLYKYDGTNSDDEAIKTSQFYHQFIGLFTHKIQYSSKQPLFNSPKVNGI